MQEAKRDGKESNVGGNCTMRVCDMAPSIFLLSLSASKRFVLFALTAASLAYFFVIVNCPVCMSHRELLFDLRGMDVHPLLAACLFMVCVPVIFTSVLDIR